MSPALIGGLSVLLLASVLQPRPEIFAPGELSTDLDEASITFTPDQKTAFFVLRAFFTTSPPASVICDSHLKAGHWTPPKVVPFSGIELDGSPSVSPDGKTLYFASRRRLSGHRSNDWNLFVVALNGESSFGEPEPLGERINTEANEINPSASDDGSLYFASDRGSGDGFSIYRAAPGQPPVKLPAEVNAGTSTAQPFIARDQSLILFASYGRPDALIAGGHPYDRPDLYLSEFRDRRWRPARHLVHGINTYAAESFPSVSPDGKWLFFSSERAGLDLPLERPLDTAQWLQKCRSILNGHSNFYRIPISALELSQ